ncbi:LutB/LldF family L-lactate oxidation iron-sulfur protein [Dyadobacter sp. 32]|uniref:LutB/LldF family L-lactate oxidation iron-sulfur protein n=1 Tax=Dyadobacter sp. 32 TaxID=538966 RepID=UPI0011EF8719
MNERERVFLEESRQKVADPDLRKKINHALRVSDEAFEKGKKQFQDLAQAREQAKNVKWDAIEHLDRYLTEFESKFTNAGGRVIWAENGQQALDAVLKICQARQAKMVVKSKSMVTEEIHLNPFLSQNGIEVVETDLGEYIQQLSNEPPYHIVAPSMHKSKEEVANLFHEKLGADPGLSPEELTLVARRTLRSKFEQAEVGITGVNFLIADIGGVAVTENEGNARLSTSFPRTHIAITGIEKVLPSVRDLDLFWPLLATHGSGQKMTVYNTIFTGPRKDSECDGPDEMIVILLDNGRTSMLADPTALESLYCIRCGACLNVCPVFRNIGGHTYKSTYSGPIGAVITPYMDGMATNKHLSYASTLCGSCTEVCPVRINLHELLLENRRRSVVVHHDPVLEKMAWKGWKIASMSRELTDLTGGGIKNFALRFFRQAWGKDRELPVFADRSFNQQWQEKKKEKR